MNWISVEDRLPEIPEGKVAVSVICAVFDRIYEECSPGNGYSVEELEFKDGMFLEIGLGRKHWNFFPVSDPVTHWMPLPREPK